MYAWLITKDCFFEAEHDPPEYDAKGTAGPHGMKLTNEEIKKHPERERFRLLDDDGGIMAYGLFVGDSASEEGFGPLDDFGTPNWGCTEIQYLNGDGVYVAL